MRVQAPAGLPAAVLWDMDGTLVDTEPYWFEVERDGVEEALIKVADSYIQLTAATRDDSPIAKAIEKRGEGLHHIGYRVDDCAAALAAMVAAGATPIDQAPRPGSRGTTVAFVHPKGSFGTLIELVQE